MAWSIEQDSALQKIAAWLKDGNGPQIFRLFGFAGTGKTTLAHRLAEDVTGDVIFCAYTGKAAMVLRSKGCARAQTIHSLIYSPHLHGEAKEPRFILSRSSRAKRASLIIVDECSMVGPDVGLDLLSFGAKVLVLGDPFQLPPVDGAGFFTEAKADVMLEDVHRQARDSPIIRMSMDVREGRRLQFGSHGESAVLRHRDLRRQDVLDADQFLIGSNHGRRQANAIIRASLGRSGPEPVATDKLVCLRNEPTRGLVNGGQYVVERLHQASAGEYAMRVVSMAEEPDKGVDVLVHRESLEDGTSIHRADPFDYGYAMTVHKAQGSQWGSVVLVNDLHNRGRDSRRWLYTGITRASRQVTVAF